MEQSTTQETGIVGLKPFDLQIADLMEKAKEVDGYLVTVENYDDAKKKWRIWYDTRLSIQKVLKSNKDVLNKMKDDQEDKAQILLDVVCPVEDQLHEGIKAIDRAKEEERQRKLLAERERVAAIRKLIDQFVEATIEAIPHANTLEKVELVYGEITEWDVKLEVYQEFYQEAIQKKSVLISKVEDRKKVVAQQIEEARIQEEEKKAFEAEQAKLREEKAKFEKEQREARAKEAADAAERKRKDDEAAAEKQRMIDEIQEKQRKTQEEMEAASAKIENEKKELARQRINNRMEVIFSKDLNTFMDDEDHQTVESGDAGDMEELMQVLEARKAYDAEVSEDLRILKEEESIAEKEKQQTFLSAKEDGIIEPLKPEHLFDVCERYYGCLDAIEQSLSKESLLGSSETLQFLSESVIKLKKAFKKRVNK